MFDSQESTPLCDNESIASDIIVVGAGTMGRGIAETALLSGCGVTLVDSDPDALQRAVEWIRSQEGISTSAAFETADSIEEAARHRSFQLAIETVAEIPEVKQDVLARLEDCLPADALIATNTSSITLQRLSSGCRFPERYCGMHFCHPVRRRRLVEVVRGEQTDAATIERAVAIAERFGKSPLVVNDAPGFVINRMLVAYLNEAMALLLEGIAIPEIEAAAREFGMPTGPFGQVDRMGIDVAVRVGTHQFFAYPDRVVPSALLVKVMKSGRTGAKSGGGFFLWSDGEIRGAIDPWVQNLIDERQVSRTQLSRQALQMRLFLPMLLEGERILAEGLVDDPARIDAALQDGLNFRAQGIGLMTWGSTSPVQQMEAFRAEFEHLGPRFHRPLTRAAA